MSYRISICSIVKFSILIMDTAWNLPQSEYSVQIFNTETVILSLGNPGDAKNDDLEIIKAPLGKSNLEKKLGKFHKFVNTIEMTESPQEKFFFGPLNKNTFHGQQPPLYSNPSRDVENGGKKPTKKSKRRKKKRTRKKLEAFRYRKEKENPKRINKRHVSVVWENEESHFDYLEKEYLDFVNQSTENKTAFKYSDEGKPEETAKEVIYKIFDVKTPKNCSSYVGVGVKAIECVLKNYKNGQLNQKQMFYTISLIVFIWFLVYLAVVLPLWCLKGWCCCCCRCKFCFPEKTVKEIQKYIGKNPPGIHTNSRGEEECHNPTQTEIELYEQLRRAMTEF